MFDHVSLGVGDIARSRRFYDAALEPLGVVALSVGDDSLGYGKDAVALWLSVSASPVAADPRSGLHFCFQGAEPRCGRRIPPRRLGGGRA